ncbi:MAG: transcription termination factor NusA [Patescibacteria group bacterium]
MPSPIEQAIRQICEEKGLAYESVLETIQIAMAAAYRKDFGEKNQNVEVTFDPESGEIKAYDVKTVVEDISEEELEAIKQAEIERREAAKAAREAGQIPAAPVEGEEDEDRFNPKLHIMITEAKTMKSDADLGEVMKIELPVPGEFGRMAAQTAKQVITQKLREAEREIIFAEFKDQEGQVVMGSVQRKEGRIVLVDIGRTTAVVRGEDQIPGERYNPGERMKFLLKEVAIGPRGPELVLSRSSEDFVRRLFESEIPEIGDGDVQIKGLAREAGSRTKIAVATDNDSIDPIGACIGQRGTRIQTIISEIGGEKIDVIEWSDDAASFITHALSPAKVLKVELNQDEHSAVVTVGPDQLSLAIGRGGQNVRLAAKLSGWKINVQEEGKPADEVLAEESTETVAPEPAAE